MTIRFLWSPGYRTPAHYLSGSTLRLPGDYAVGTAYVLQTAGYAKTGSGLDVQHFCRTPSVEMISRDGLEEICDIVETIADAKGLSAQAGSVHVRRKCNNFFLKKHPSLAMVRDIPSTL